MNTERASPRNTARAEPTPAAVRAQLERILASPDFERSARNRAFLRFVVEETLAERAEDLGGYQIGLTVFGRDDSFDPQSDPIVRTQAVRLRRAIETYEAVA